MISIGGGFPALPLGGAIGGLLIALIVIVALVMILKSIFSR